MGVAGCSCTSGLERPMDGEAMTLLGVPTMLEVAVRETGGAKTTPSLDSSRVPALSWTVSSSLSASSKLRDRRLRRLRIGALRDSAVLVLVLGR